MTLLAKSLVLSVLANIGASTAYEAGAGWTLDWSDEFNGNSLDTKTWNYETGGNQPNAELETYTNSPNNIWLGNGSLNIQALDHNGQYTSARINSAGHKTLKYGKLVSRIQGPYGQGIWPAFWMLGENIGTAGWPACGEIDIFEMIGGGCGRDDTNHFSTHWRNSNGQQGDSTISKSLANCEYLSKNFHEYEVEWNYNEIIGRMDGNQIFSMNTGNNANVQAFQQPFFIIFNLAVGGNWPGNPNPSTHFPQQMKVDWVRHYVSKSSSDDYNMPSDSNDNTKGDVDTSSGYDASPENLEIEVAKLMQKYNLTGAN